MFFVFVFVFRFVHSALREASILALTGQSVHGSIETALTATFELLNLVPADKLNPLKSAYNKEKYDRHRSKSNGGGGGRANTTERDNNKRLAITLTTSDNSEGLTKWRRVGSVSGSAVRLDTIIWPGGDIVVSGKCVSDVIYCGRKFATIHNRFPKQNKKKWIFLNKFLFTSLPHTVGLSARARSVFRVVTALAPPFVMESELDEDGLCLRGLPCHFLSPIGLYIFVFESETESISN